MNPSSALLTKALQVPCHLSAQRQIACIEPLDLLNVDASVLGLIYSINQSTAPALFPPLNRPPFVSSAAEATLLVCP